MTCSSLLSVSLLLLRILFPYGTCRLVVSSTTFTLPPLRRVRSPARTVRVSLSDLARLGLKHVVVWRSGYHTIHSGGVRVDFACYLRELVLQPDIPILPTSVLLAGGSRLVLRVVLSTCVVA